MQVKTFIPFQINTVLLKSSVCVQTILTTYFKSAREVLFSMLHSFLGVYGLNIKGKDELKMLLIGLSVDYNF